MSKLEKDYYYIISYQTKCTLVDWKSALNLFILITLDNLAIMIYLFAVKQTDVKRYCKED